MTSSGLIEKYFDRLPVKDRENIVTLYEGGTPLIRARNLERHLGAQCEIYLKYEGLNPTGSFKDRGMTVAVSKAKEDGSRTVVCASTGNTSASAAAYAARAGMGCLVLVPNKGIAVGKLAQAMAYGATVLAVEGNFDTALTLVRELAEKHPVTLVNSVNPYRIEGQKTAAFEVTEQLGTVPDYLAIPVGNAGNITAYWKGFKEQSASSLAGRPLGLPKMLGFQAAGAAPIVDGRPVSDPQTLATAIKIGNPASWKGATAALEESGGRIGKVTDEEIVEAYKTLARTEGVFAEPASAAPIAGIAKLIREGYLREGRVVCILTGNGLKDPDSALKALEPPRVVAAEIKEIERFIAQ
ncbi:MAG: threonine synthase [Bacillota bacterium]